MFDPTKLLPQNQNNVNILIEQKKTDPTTPPPTPASPPPVPGGDSGPQRVQNTTQVTEETQTFTHFQRPKVGAKRQVRIIQQDNTQRRQQAAVELVQSERMYALMMDQFFRAFVTPLVDSPNTYGFTPSQTIALSQSLSDIIQFTTGLSNNPQLGTDPQVLFKEKFQDIVNMYTLYCQKSVQVIFGLLNDALKHKKFRHHCHVVQVESGLNIVDHLLIPINRLSVYELILRKYAASFDANGGDIEKATHGALISIADALKGETTDEYLHQVDLLERMGRLLAIQFSLSISSNSVIYLWNPERRLVLEEVVYKAKINMPTKMADDMALKGEMTRDMKLTVGDTHGENKRKILLFNDQLLWTTDAPDMRYKGHVALTDIIVFSQEIAGPAGEEAQPVLVVRQNRLAKPKDDDEEDPITHKKKPQQPAKPGAPAAGSEEGWVLVFNDRQRRDGWFREFEQLQAQLKTITTSSSLTIPIEVQEEKTTSKCTIL